MKFILFILMIPAICFAQFVLMPQKVSVEGTIFGPSIDVYKMVDQSTGERYTLVVTPGGVSVTFVGTNPPDSSAVHVGVADPVLRQKTREKIAQQKGMAELPSKGQ
jgi:hypothetical protein